MNNYKEITLRCFKQYMAFKNGLDTTDSVGWHSTDRRKVKTCWYWFQSYLNGLKLMGIITQEKSES